jgi:hypothetical protein
VSCQSVNLSDQSQYMNLVRVRSVVQVHESSSTCVSEYPFLVENGLADIYYRHATASTKILGHHLELEMCNEWRRAMRGGEGGIRGKRAGKRGHPRGRSSEREVWTSEVH